MEIDGPSYLQGTTAAAATTPIAPPGAKKRSYDEFSALENLSELPTPYVLSHSIAINALSICLAAIDFVSVFGRSR